MKCIKINFIETANLLADDLVCFCGLYRMKDQYYIETVS